MHLFNVKVSCTVSSDIFLMSNFARGYRLAYIQPRVGSLLYLMTFNWKIKKKWINSRRSTAAESHFHYIKVILETFLFSPSKKEPISKKM